MILAVLLIAQIVTPPPNIAPTPVSVSERAVLDKGLADAQSSAQALGGLLGASIVDLSTGVDAQINGDQPFSMAQVQRLPLAVLAYRGVDAGVLSLAQPVPMGDSSAPPSTLGELLEQMLVGDDASAATAVMHVLHGADSINATLHTIDFDGIFIEPDDGGYASPVALTRFMSQVMTDTLLKPASSDALLASLAKVDRFRYGLRSGLRPPELLQHETGTIVTDDVARVTDEVGIAHIPGHVLLIAAMLRDAGGTDRQRESVLAQVARAAVDAATATPGTQ
jgi:beta-lactamase class A